MRRKGRVCCGIGIVLASITLACGQPAGQTQTSTPPALSPDTNQVIITVHCPPADANGAAFRVNVHPQIKHVDAGVSVVWTRVRTGPPGGHDGTFSIAPLDAASWPWTSSTTPLWTGADEIIGAPKDSQDRTELKYSITVECNNDKVVFDPRMKVR